MEVIEEKISPPPGCDAAYAWVIMVNSLSLYITKTIDRKIYFQ